MATTELRSGITGSFSISTRATVATAVVVELLAAPTVVVLLLVLMMVEEEAPIAADIFRLLPLVLLTSVPRVCVCVCFST